MQKSTPPVRKVFGDDYIIEVDGVSYHPHVGDWVEYVPVSTVDEMTVALKFQRLSKVADSEMSPETLEELGDTLDQILRILSRGIASWKWTDARGRALSSPPELEELRQIDLSEVIWLVSQKTVKISDEERKKDSSTSTSPSKVKSLPRQKNG